jgi:hypothetical protein
LPHQIAVVDSAARFKVVRAGRRGGKTVLAEGCSVVGHGPRANGVPLYKGIAQDRDIVWVARDYTQAGIMWHEFIRPRFKGVAGVKVNEADRTVTLRGAGTLFVISAENIMSAKGMGKRLGGVVIEEGAWLDLKTVLRDVILPALMDNEGWLLIISTTNAGPDGGKDDYGQPQTPSYFNVICEEVRAGSRTSDWAEFHFTAQDNPKITDRAFGSLVSEYPDGSVSLRQEVFAELLRGGVGMALPQLSKARHVIPRQRLPEHWTRFGAFDWGYDHPWCFGDFRADEDGNVILVDTLWGREDLPDAQAEKIANAFGDDFRYIVAGHDCWNKVKARGETTPTIAEQFWAHDPRIRLDKANTSRESGLTNLRLYTQWKATETHRERVPKFRMMETDGNLRVLAQLEAMQVDPKNVNDALKVDARGGVGGDDGYDMVRYGLASRPLKARPLEPGPRDPNLSADPSVKLVLRKGMKHPEYIGPESELEHDTHGMSTLGIPD